MSGKRKQAVRACLITSERSGSGEFDLEAVLSVLFEQGWDVAVRPKYEKGEAVALAKGAAEDGYDPIVNCGGDGTLNEIVDALAGSDVAVGDIPGGTENVWSKQIGVARRSKVAAMQLVAAERAKVDVGVVEVNGKHASSFLMMAGLGADASVMSRVSRPLKNRLGPLAVGVAAIQSLPSLQTADAHVRLDHTVWEGTVSQVVVGNIRMYGGFTAMTPDAFVDDGMLDVCLVTAADPLSGARQLASLVLRRHPGDATAEIYRAAHLSIRLKRSLPLQVDGTVLHVAAGDDVEYTFRVRPRALTVLVPKTYDWTIFQRSPKTKRKKGS